MARIAQTTAFNASTFRSLSSVPFKRKVFAKLQRAFVLADRTRGKTRSFETHPVVIVNSLPKSGTHLLMQVAEALPGTVQLGSFIAQRPSWANWYRSEAQILKRIGNLAPGECAGAHLHYRAGVSEALCALNPLHLFIYRDPRAVLVSEVQYLVQTARWNALHSRFANLDTLKEALDLAIEGDASDALPDVQSRYQPYLDWRDDPNVFAIRFEDLSNPATCDVVLRDIVEQHEMRSGNQTDPGLLGRLRNAIRPGLSHTYSGQSPERWKNLLTREQQEKLVSLFPCVQ